MFLGRPISVAGWKAAGSGDSGVLRFLVARRGQGSRDLIDMRPGEQAELIGPLGNYWAQADILSSVAERGSAEAAGSIALIGGGIGIAPLLFFADELADNTRNSEPVPFDVYAGFRAGFFALESLKSGAARSFTIATEDGSDGVKGLVTDFFTPAGYRAVFACGPEPMLKAVSGSCIASGVSCFVSLEKHMACGVGACLGCTVKTIDGNRRCCADGPIFNAEEVCFDA